jgi:hypothetical protein
MEFFFLRMVKYHPIMIFCQHYAKCKFCKMEFGPSFFMLGFGPPNHAKTQPQNALV